jgi:hypothetical protein
LVNFAAFGTAAAAFAAAAAAAAMVATLWLLQDVYSHAFTPLSCRAPMHITAILLVVLLSTAAAHRAEPRQVAPDTPPACHSNSKQNNSGAS